MIAGICSLLPSNSCVFNNNFVSSVFLTIIAYYSIFSQDEIEMTGTMKFDYKELVSDSGGR